MSTALLILGAKRTDGVAAPLLVTGDRIGGDPSAADRLDATGLHLAPGIVDLGAFAVDLQACLFGGITRVALMPDGSPPLDGPGLIQRAAIAAKPHLWVHPIAAATQGLAGTALAEIGLMKGAGARAVATGRRWIADSRLMQSVLSYAAALDLTVISHAEDDGLVAGAVATAGETATRLGLPAAPACAEAIAVARDIALAAETGARLHLRQVTTAAGFDLVRRAKDRGVSVTCGITPAHLLLSDTAIGDFRTFAHLSPPLRDEADRHAALDALSDGTIDVLHSGHDPRGPEDKRLPFADSAPGMAAAGHLLALGLGLVRDERIGMARLFDLLSRNPARLLGIDAGHLGVGAPADLILFDPDAPWQISSDRMPGQAGNTPFDGLPVQGRVRRVMKGGRWLS